jgi:hypothetical protein
LAHFSLALAFSLTMEQRLLAAVGIASRILIALGRERRGPLRGKLLPKYHWCSLTGDRNVLAFARPSAAGALITTGLDCPMTIEQFLRSTG